MCERRERQEFNKLLMSISVGCQDLNHVVDNLFANLKGKYVFNSLDDLVHSVAISKHQLYLKEVLDRLHSVDFTLDKQIIMGASEIRYLGHYLSFTVTRYCRGYKQLSLSAQFGQCAAFCWEG